MNVEQLDTNAHAMVAKGKGILAADESTGTMGKRLEGIGVESTEANRRDYREMLVSTQGAGKFISGAILFDETLRQSGGGGTSMVAHLTAEGILPGIKVDTGAKNLAGCPGEKITEGLDGLRERLAGYYEIGARFTKWRAVITIGDKIPSRTCIAANAHALARFAALAQEANLVPIVEPEVLMDGGHTIERCREVSEETLHVVFDALLSQRVRLEGIVLKPNMIVSGKDCPRQAGVDEVVEHTLAVLRRHVPAAVPGIAFLSGGQSEESATQHLNVMNSGDPQPWELTFSYGRALQQSALKTWGGNPANVSAAQAVYYHRARMNGLSRTGDYRPEMEKEAA
jgi:fructose-bisphosphate aldolase class I